MGTKDIHDIYNLFNAMIKHRYNLSLKASSQSVIRSSFPDYKLGIQVAGVMDYMESPKVYEENGHIYLKDSIKKIYEGLQ